MIILLLLFLCYIVPVLGLWNQPSEFDKPEYPKTYEQFCFPDEIDSEDYSVDYWDRLMHKFLDKQKKVKHDTDKKRSITAKKKDKLIEKK